MVRGHVVDLLDDHAHALRPAGGSAPSLPRMYSARPRTTPERRADLVGDAGGEHADGGQLLGAQELALERAHLAEVLDDEQQRGPPGSAARAARRGCCTAPPRRTGRGARRTGSARGPRSRARRRAARRRRDHRPPVPRGRPGRGARRARRRACARAATRLAAVMARPSESARTPGRDVVEDLLGLLVQVRELVGVAQALPARAERRATPIRYAPSPTSSSAATATAAPRRATSDWSCARSGAVDESTAIDHCSEPAPGRVVKATTSSAPPKPRSAASRRRWWRCLAGRPACGRRPGRGRAASGGRALRPGHRGGQAGIARGRRARPDG